MHTCKKWFISIISISMVLSIQSCSVAMTGEITDEERVFERVLSAEEYNDLGVAYERSGENQLALESFARAIDVDETYVTAWVNLGNVYSKLSDYKRAEEAYRQALKIDDTLIEARNNLSWIYIEQKIHLETACELVKECAENETVYQPYCLHTSGMAHYQLGENDTAIEIVTKAIKVAALSGSDILLLGQLHFDLGTIYQYSQQQESAITSFQKSIEIAPQSEWAKKAQERIDFLTQDAE